jgi:hypothetical protein
VTENAFAVQVPWPKLSFIAQAQTEVTAFPKNIRSCSGGLATLSGSVKADYEQAIVEVGLMQGPVMGATRRFY